MVLEEVDGFLAKEDVPEDAALSEQLVKTQDQTNIISKGKKLDLVDVHGGGWGVVFGVECLRVFFRVFCSVFVWVNLAGVEALVGGDVAAVAFATVVATTLAPSFANASRSRYLRFISVVSKSGTIFMIHSSIYTARRDGAEGSMRVSLKIALYEGTKANPACGRSSRRRRWDTCWS